MFRNHDTIIRHTVARDSGLILTSWGFLNVHLDSSAGAFLHFAPIEIRRPGIEIRDLVLSSAATMVAGKGRRH